MDELHEQEKAKYEKVWQIPNYGAFSPGEQFTKAFIDFSAQQKPRTMYDYGAGCGRAALFFKLTGIDVKPIDIVDTAMDEHCKMVFQDELILANLWDLPDLPEVDCGFCTDVMEHIPPEKVDDVLANIRRTSKYCFFSICFTEDHFGQTIEETLHLSVFPYFWWVEKLEQFGKVIQARDLIHNGLFMVEWSDD